MRPRNQPAGVPVSQLYASPKRADHRAMVARPPAPPPLLQSAELNTAIDELLRQLNDERLIRRLGITRRAIFEQLDRPTSTRCRRNPIALPNGASAELVSITTSSSKVISTACRTALPAMRWRCG